MAATMTGPPRPLSGQQSCQAGGAEMPMETATTGESGGNFPLAARDIPQWVRRAGTDERLQLPPLHRALVTENSGATQGTRVGRAAMSLSCRDDAPSGLRRAPAATARSPPSRHRPGTPADRKSVV